MGCTSANLKVQFNNIDTKKEVKGEIQEIIQGMAPILDKSDDFIQLLRQWESNQKIVDAVKDNNEKTLVIALEASTEILEKLFAIFEYSNEIYKLLEKVLEYFLSQFNPKLKMNVTLLEKKISDNWEIIKNLSKILSVIILLDNEKKSKTSIQNDLALIKRLISSHEQLRSTMNKPPTEQDTLKVYNWCLPKTIDESIVSSMVHFYSNQAPFLAFCIKKTKENIDQHEDSYTFDIILPYIPNILLDAIQAQILEQSQAKIFTEAIACSVIFIDHLLPEGVFHSRSVMKINQIVDLLTCRSDDLLGKNHQVNTKMLLSLIKFWSLHLKEERTPNKLQNRFTVN